MAGGRKTAVVIGNGPVGHRFCEKLVEFDGGRDYGIVAFCEEPRPAYDRVHLTSYFDHRDPAKLAVARIEWYRENGIQLHVGDRARRIDRSRRMVVSEAGLEIPYDCVVLATGSRPFVPPIEGIDKRGVFVYRTIEDLDAIIEYAKQARSCAVIGGGLLGLEAAKAAYDLGLETHVIEFASRLMPRQIDEAGSNLLVRQIEALGVRVHLHKATQGVLGNGRVTGMEFSGGGGLDVDMIIVSAGIRPRDELARDCGLEVGPRGGITVDDELQTTDPDIYAIGEAALHRGTIYGLIAPGWEMADVTAGRLAGRDVRFEGAKLSTKLKLMGVDVASFGDYEAPAESAVPLVVDDPFAGVYKKLLFSADGKRLVGGVLVGDASGYSELSALAESDEDLPFEPARLAGVGGEGAADISSGIGDDAQVCFCNNVTKGAICSAVREHDLTTVAAVKEHTSAGTGCGGCVPMVTGLLNAELEAAGKAVKKSLCEHFEYTRQDLFEIVKVKGIRTFEELIRDHGQGYGCEICKPAVTSILASLWNESITDPSHHTLQDTNDRFLANMQRGGLYSIVPRVPGGEITPAKLIALGTVAKKYGLYTKITGGQRVDLFGCAGAPAALHLGRADRGGLRERARLWQGAAHHQELRRHHLVPLRGPRFGRVRCPHREALPGHPRSAQGQGRGVRLRSRVRRGAIEGHWPDRDRDRIQPLRLRKRRGKAPARRLARFLPRRGDSDPIYRPLLHVLHHDRGQADSHVGLDRAARGRHRAHQGRGRPRQARHLR